jgi:uracil-DNA glycosylase
MLEKYLILRPNLRSHPRENDIVSEARQDPQRRRLLEELQQTRPRLVVTLGNAALRVMRDLLGSSGTLLPEKLSTEPNRYGQTVFVSRSKEMRFGVLPLAHPASAAKYQRAHDAWISKARAPDAALGKNSSKRVGQLKAMISSSEEFLPEDRT